MYDRIVVIDFETTGLSPGAQPVESAWIEIDEDLVPLGTHSSLHDPGIPIEESARATHGISDEQVKGHPSWINFLAASNPFACKVLAIAHNAAFDARFLRPHCRSLDLICTKRLAWSVYPGAPNNKLSTLAEYLDLKIAPTHRALADVETCLAVVRQMRTETGLSLSEMRDKSKAALDTMTMPFGKHKGTQVKFLPRGYVSWMRENMDLNGDLQEALDKAFPLR
jgi:DNA polymerase III epsilon subunit-like protein